MATASRTHTILLKLKGRLSFLGLLFFLAWTPSVQAGCLDLLRGEPQKLSTTIYETSLTDPDFKPRLTGLLPEEWLAHLARTSPGTDLLRILKEHFGVDRIRFGSKFRMARWPHRVLTLERPLQQGDIENAEYALRFVRFLFETKRRHLKWSPRPIHYLRTLENLTADLEPLVAPALQALYPESGREDHRRLVGLRLTLRSLLLMGPGPHLWSWSAEAQAEGRRQDRRFQMLHWSITRSFAALYIAAMASSLASLPDAVENLRLLNKLRPDLIELGEQMAHGEAYDRRAERERLIEKYQQRVDQLAEDLALDPDGEDSDARRARLEDFRSAIAAMKKELLQMPQP